MRIRLAVREPVDDAAVCALHAAAFDEEPGGVTPMAARLERHDASWATAHDGDELVGFVRAVWDGGQHAFVLDTVVAPRLQGQGLGTMLLGALVQDCRARGIRWLHVDFEPRLASFYRGAGFAPTRAGLIDLTA
ncbi:GNAT family N-acetyltransferase [Agrococcus sp. SL85]|uniref:GNAT family N-acetyltransferase n=1 Tax=Agrococcus sp. SL85 TaxID=2995141 RepID=UPI00226CA548|nr:GNAT family N-acetyltransferase [Agrococcus sp. SL85]WAC66617.1 GNAT family N-acetyltransferase [Agrococcus sp. SL85]